MKYQAYVPLTGIYSQRRIFCVRVTDRPEPSVIDTTVTSLEQEPLAQDLGFSQEQVCARVREEQKQSEIMIPVECVENEAGRVLFPKQNSTPDDAATCLSLESLRPFPKAPSRKLSQRGRKPGKTRILTDTPEKIAIRNEAIVKTEKKRKCEERKEKRKKRKRKDQRRNLCPSIFIPSQALVQEKYFRTK